MTRLPTNTVALRRNIGFIRGLFVSGETRPSLPIAGLCRLPLSRGLPAFRRRSFAAHQKKQPFKPHSTFVPA